MIPWNVIVPLAAALSGMLVSLYIKDKAYEAARAEFSKSITSALAVFKNELLETMDKTYMRSGECRLRMEAQDDRIDVGDLALREVEKRLLNLTPKPHKAN